jgi:hypothetical protein
VAAVETFVFQKVGMEHEKLAFLEMSGLHPPRAVRAVKLALAVWGLRVVSGHSAWVGVVEAVEAELSPWAFSPWGFSP